MSKQTAVEWLVDEYFGGVENCVPNFRHFYEQAKQMEKEQKIDFSKRCLDKALDTDIRTAHLKVEQYYNDFYGGKNG